MMGIPNYDTVQVHNGIQMSISYLQRLVMSRYNKHTQLKYGTEILKIKWHVSPSSINRLVFVAQK